MVCHLRLRQLLRQLRACLPARSGRQARRRTLQQRRLRRGTQNRGEAALPATATAQTLWNELTHEYICDFRGEGQLFYYYKRRNLSSIDDGNYNGNTVSVPASAYVLPLPDYEKQFGY